MVKDEVSNRLIIQVEYETDEDREAALEDLAFLLTNNLVLIGEAGTKRETSGGGSEATKQSRTCTTGQKSYWNV